MSARPANPLVSPLDDDHWYARRSGVAQGLRRVYDRAAASLVTRSGPGGIRVLRRAGEVLHRLGVVPPGVSDVQSLFPDRTTRACGIAARDAAGQRFANRAMAAVFERGTFPLLRDMVDDVSSAPPDVLARRSGGIVVAAWHVGVHFGLSAAATRWGMKLVVLRNLPIGSPEMRALTMKEGVEALRAGEVVVVVADGPGGASCDPVDWLGRQVRLRRGPFALARLTSVPVVPVLASWTPRGTIQVRSGPALWPGAGSSAVAEQALAAAAAAWVGAQLETCPGDLWPYTLANLLEAPRSALGEGG